MRYHETPITVRFCEVDAYRVAWHGHYVAWMEIGRLDLAGRFGLDAFQLAEVGYLGPVISLQLKYLRPARFNDQLTVKTRLSYDESTTLNFESVIVDATGTRLAVGTTVHALTDLQGVLQYQLPTELSNRLARLRAWLELP